MRYRIDRDELSDFLARQVRLVEHLPAAAEEAAADGYGAPIHCASFTLIKIVSWIRRSR